MTCSLARFGAWELFGRRRGEVSFLQLQNEAAEKRPAQCFAI